MLKSRYVTGANNRKKKHAGLLLGQIRGGGIISGIYVKPPDRPLLVIAPRGRFLGGTRTAPNGVPRNEKLPKALALGASVAKAPPAEIS